MGLRRRKLKERVRNVYILAEGKSSRPISASSIIGKREKHVIEISWVKQNEKYINNAVFCVGTIIKVETIPKTKFAQQF